MLLVQNTADIIHKKGEGVRNRVPPAHLPEGKRPRRSFLFGLSVMYPAPSPIAELDTERNLGISEKYWVARLARQDMLGAFVPI